MSEGSEPLVDTEKQTYAKAVEAAADEAVRASNFEPRKPVKEAGLATLARVEHG